MYAVITKFVANSTDARYFSINYLNHVLEKNNLDDQGNNLIPPLYYDPVIFTEQLDALKAYRDSFAVGHGIVMYGTFFENFVTYSVQVFNNQEDFNLENAARSRLQTSRDAFLNKINVSLIAIKVGQVPSWDSTFAEQNSNLTSLPFSQIEQYYNSF